MFECKEFRTVLEYVRTVEYAYEPQCCVEHMVDLAQKVIGNAPSERMMVVWFNFHNKFLGYEIIAIGTQKGITFNTSDLFRGAIKANAYSIVVAHNHPSGSLWPSDEDVRTTAAMKEASKTLGIVLHDHLIVTHLSSNYYSFAENTDVAQ